MKNVLYQLSTHWDREWYLPFQGFRYGLVDMMDNLLSALEDNRIPGFVFDGQTVVLEDYLEIRPEMRESLEKHIRSGRLRVGPWYGMPDEFLVSGESLLENLLVGQNVSRAFGAEPWRFGYVNDIFGHVAQLPQIFRGFDIDGAYLGRGVDTSYPHGSFFRWLSPDGSCCYVYKDNYTRVKASMDKAENKTEALTSELNKNPPPLPAILNYTNDHAVIDANTDRFLATLAEGEKNGDCVVVGGLEKLAEVLAPVQDSLAVIQGELAQVAVKNDDFRLVTNSLSSWIPLKQENDRVEARLYRETAPLLVLGEHWGKLSGKRPFFHLARKYLLKNQPHDSICGCSVDAVHENMPYRYAQANEIADALWFDLRDKLTDGSGEEGMTLLVVNPDVHAREDVLTLDIDLPRNWKPVWVDNLGYRQVCLFTLVDENGAEIPYQILKSKRDGERYEKQQTIPIQRYTIAAKVHLRPSGITAFRVKPSGNRGLVPPYAPPSLPTVENESLTLQVETDGTLTVTDKQSGETYRNLLNFVEDGDCGNGWFYGEVDPDAPVTLSHGCPAKVEVLSAGAFEHTFRITQTMTVPRKLERYGRTADTTDMTLTTEVTLRQGNRYIECTTHVTSDKAYPTDQRLRLLWHTGIPGDTYETSQAFCYLTRPRGVTAVGLNGREVEQVEKNTGGIVSLGPVAFVGGEGFHEGGVYPDGTISMTLFRRVGKMFHQPEPGQNELPQDLHFRYGLAFGMTGAEMMQVQQDMTVKPLTITVPGVCDGKDSLVSLDEKKLLMSTLKPAEGNKGAILRLYNPTADVVDCHPVFADGYEAMPVTMAEKALDTKVITNETWRFQPWEIKTYLIQKI